MELKPQEFYDMTPGDLIDMANARLWVQKQTDEGFKPAAGHPGTSGLKDMLDG